jgi:hypothetical protein
MNLQMNHCVCGGLNIARFIMLLFIFQNNDTVAIQIQTSSVNGVIQPLVDDYVFPPQVNITTIEFESVSHTLFAYGQQVLLSASISSVIVSVLIIVGK